MSPSYGYKLPLWHTSGYRATAVAYMQREKVSFIEHINGKTYSLQALKNDLVGYKIDITTKL